MTKETLYKITFSLFCISFIFPLIFITGCAAYSSNINLPVEPVVSSMPQQKQICILVSRFGGTTPADQEVVPQLLRILPEVLRQQSGFSEVRLESEGKGQSNFPTLIIKGVVENASNAAVPTPMMTTINFNHSSEVQFTVYDVSNIEPTKRFDDTLQTTVFTFDITSAEKIFSGVVKTKQKASYGAQANIPKLVSSVLGIASKDLSIQIGNQVYQNCK